VAYILAGIIVGPMLLNITSGSDSFELFSQVGITILLFIVGLHLNPTVIKEVGSVSLITGIAQVLFTSLIGFGIGIVLGLDKVAALYVSIALTFSSTIIILKLLSDKGHVHTLYGRISVGMLLVQDLIATIILLVVSTTAGVQDGPWWSIALPLVLKALVIFLTFVSMMKWVLPLVLKRAGQSPELLFLFAIAWGLSCAGIFQLLGFSVEIGALIAGVVLSSSPLIEEISAKLRPLRDFFIVIFFVLLGSHIVLSDVVTLLPKVLILSAFVLIGNPAIVFIVMNLLGFHRKTGFLTGLTVAQISEFSLILAALAFQIGYISRETVTLITMVGLITITGSTYLILNAEWLYQKMIKLLILLELRKNDNADKESTHNYQALLIGYDQIGASWVKVLRKLDIPFLVIDFNPATIAELTEQKIPCLYGDAGNSEFLSEVPVGNLKLVVSSVNDVQANELIIRFFKTQSRRCIFIVFTAFKGGEAILKAAGASIVINPLQYSAHRVAKVIVRTGLNKKVLEQTV
jgi:Kef-type K+ transport system membrane component KefB